MSASSALHRDEHVTGGFKEQFREKVLGVNAHVLVLKYSLEFREYREVMKKVEKVPRVTGVAPFIINPMMVTHGDRTATGVLLKGVDPDLMPKVLDLPKHIVGGSMEGLCVRAKPPEKPNTPAASGTSSPLRDLQQRDAGSFLDVIEDQIRRDALDAGAPLPRRSTPERRRWPTPFPRRPQATPRRTAASPASPGRRRSAFLGGPGPVQEPKAAALPGLIIGKSFSTQRWPTIGDCVQITSPMVGMSFGGSSQKPPIAK